MMSGIFGIFMRDGTPLSRIQLQHLCGPIAEQGKDVSSGLLEGGICLRNSGMRAIEPPIHASLNGTAPQFRLVSAGRVYNREELGRNLSIDKPELVGLSDGELIARAYAAWGEESVKRIYGDWSFAAWHPEQRKLFLARDHTGNTALYYYSDQNIFVFASSWRDLVDLKLFPVRINDQYLARMLLSMLWGYDESTIFHPICRLLPAHAITVTPRQVKLAQYWSIEDTPPLQLSRFEEYVEAFTDIFSDAVISRTSSSDARGEGGAVGIALSGGLDSGAVAAVAAKHLKASGRALKAFTSVPLMDDSAAFVGSRFANELPYARMTAEYAGNIDLAAIEMENVTPIQGVVSVLDLLDIPVRNAGNSFWFINLLRHAKSSGCSVMLTGQRGNGGISWQGDVLSQPFLYQLSEMGLRPWFKARIKQIVPPAVYQKYLECRISETDWCSSYAFNPEFASRLSLRQLKFQDCAESLGGGALETRLATLSLFNNGGALYAHMGEALGLQITDPTADPRVLALTFAVPDRFFIDRSTGLNRFLIREAMKGLLPDPVRLNTLRGRQSGDLVPRLRSSAPEVEATLEALSLGPAAEYFDFMRLKQIWQQIQAEDSVASHQKAVTVLMRGIMMGLFVHRFHGYSDPAGL